MSQNRKLSRQFIIDKDFQFSFLRIFVLLGIVQMILQLIVVFYFKNNFTELLTMIGQKESDPLFIFLQKQTQFLFISSLCINFGFLITLILIGLYLSQKIAGPIRKTINHLNRNDENILEFRKDDYFQDLAETINRYKRDKLG